MLDEIVSVRLPKSIQTRWNFNIRTINIVHGHKEDLIICMDEVIATTLQTKTIN